MNERGRPALVALPELAAAVPNASVLGVGGLHFNRLPLALLHALVDRQPRDLHFVGWNGGLPLELLLAARAVKKLTFCFSSLDIFGMAPLFREAMEGGTLEVDEIPALALIQSLKAAQQNLPSLPFQAPHGSVFMERGRLAKIAPDPLTESVVGIARPLHLDVLILHAGRADTAGNVELTGALGLDYSLIWAAKKILVTVEEVVPEGTFQQSGRSRIIPRTIVSALAVVPGGAWPASCLPYYTADFLALLTMTQRKSPADLRPLPERLARLERLAQVTKPAVEAAVLRRNARPLAGDEVVAGSAEQMIVTLARTCDSGSICAAGAVTPLAIIAYLLAKGSHAPGLTLMTVSSGYFDVAVRPMLLVTADAVDHATAAIHCGGDDIYHEFYQRGLVTHEVVGAAQIDQHARCNNIALRKPDGSVIRLPGQGGMADVANMHQNFILYVPRHSPRVFVPQVEIASAARGVLDDSRRAAAGWQPGRVIVVTNLCVFELNRASERLEVTSLHPGVSFEQVAEATGFELQRPPILPTTPPPTDEERRLIREVIDPLGIRRLEFVASKERGDLISELIQAEEAMLADCT